MSIVVLFADYCFDDILFYLCVLTTREVSLQDLLPDIERSNHH